MPRNPRDLTIKLEILEFLSRPENTEKGVIGWLVGANISGVKGVDTDRVLKELVESGLVERRPIPTHKTAKPHFISQQGIVFLAANRTQGNEASDSLSVFEQSVVDVLAKQPEFANADQSRLLEVGRQIASACRKPESRLR